MKKFNNFEVFLCNKVGKKLTKIAEKFRLKKTCCSEQNDPWPSLTISF